MVQVYYCPWTFYNDHMCSVVRNEIYTCIAISWIVSTPISICDVFHLSKLWKLKALCSVKPCRHCDVITIKINQVKICFSLSELNLRNDLKLLVSPGINETAALYCIVIVYELLFLASLQWQHFSLYSTRRLRYCNASHINSHL